MKDLFKWSLRNVCFVSRSMTLIKHHPQRQRIYLTGTQLKQYRVPRIHQFMAIVSCLLLFSVCATPTHANQIISDTPLSTAGYFNLSWSSDRPAPYIVQQSLDASFNQVKTIYQGSDQASVMSGLPDGQYFYRMQASAGQWSEAVKVEVKHHSLEKAFAFFTAGAVMLFILVFVLIKGARHAED